MSSCYINITEDCPTTIPPFPNKLPSKPSNNLEILISNIDTSDVAAADMLIEFDIFWRNCQVL